MKSLSLITAAGMVAASLSLVACAGNGGNAAPTAVAPAQAALGQDPGASVANVGGQYAGTVKDSVLGKGHATASLAQYRNAAGGPIVSAYRSTTLTASLAAVAGANNVVSGTIVASNASATCTFKFGGVYDSVAFRLSGSYVGVGGCSGESGRFELKQKCYYVRDGASIRPDHGPAPC